MIKVISVALFGEQYEKYAVYVPAFLLGALNVFPQAQGWRVLVYIDVAVKSDVLARMRAHDLVDVALMPTLPLAKAMLHRLDPVWGADADFVFCRDLDSPPMPRDRACCEDFICMAADKKCSLHTIHDSDQHVGIMGGLCGTHAPSFRDATNLRSLEQLYAAAELTAMRPVPWEEHGTDQHVLNRLFLRNGGPRLHEHRYAGWHEGPGKKPSREIGKYPCGGVSSPVPDAFYGVPGFCVEEIAPGLLQERADLLGGHLGCAGYDYKAAEKFWREHGSSKIAAQVDACV